MSKRKNNRKKRKMHVGLLIGFCVILVCAVMGIRYYIQYKEEKALKALTVSYQREIEAMPSEYQRWKDVVDTEAIYSGISVMGVELGGCTKEEAVLKLDAYYSQEVLEKKIIFTYEELRWEYKYSDLGFTADTEAIVEEAYALYRTGDIKGRYEAIMKLQKEPMDLVLQDQYEDAAVDEILNEIKTEVDVEVKDAQLHRKDGEFVITPEEVGCTVDMEAVKSDLQARLGSSQDIELELTVEEVQPSRTEEDMAQINDAIGSFVTYYSMGDAGRNKNLEVGCSRVNGLVLMPGESFNFNNTVSPVDTASGYMNASTIVNGEYVPGIGGGLCQVCTTLYNAVIRAELQVTERYAHSREPGYVTNGQDAAMSIGGKNFQFVNSSEYPIYISMSAYGGTLSCTIYGLEEHDPSRKVSFESVLVGTIAKPDPIITEDDTMDEGTEEVTSEGCEGLKYDVYKVVTENGETTREYFNSSTYYPVADRVTKGTKPVEESEESSEEEEETESEVPEEESSESINE